MSAATTLSLTAEVVASPTVYAQPFNLRAALGWDAFANPFPPSGNITFKDGATVLGTAAVNASGQASFTLMALPVGVHSLTAEYSGDATFLASTSAALPWTVTAAASSVVLNVVPSPVGLGQPVSLFVSAALTTPASGWPTGTVTLKDGATTIGTVTLDAQGHGSLVVSTLPAGIRALTAVVAGNANVQTSTSSVVSLLVMAATKLDLAAMEDALHAWVVAALGLQAVWSQSNAAAPATKPYGWLTLVGPVKTTNAQVIDETNLANPAGQEVEQTVIQHEEWAFAIEVISGETSGPSSARSLLIASAIRLQLPSAIDAMNLAGLAVIDVGDTQDLTALFGTKFESRARLNVRLRTVNTATEKTGYIQRVGVTSPFGAWPQLPP